MGTKILRETLLYGKDLIEWTIMGIGAKIGWTIASTVMNKFVERKDTSKKEEA